MELLHIWLDWSSALLAPLIRAFLKRDLIHDDCSQVWFIMDWYMVEEYMTIWMKKFLFHHLRSGVCISVTWHDWGIGICLHSYSGISVHSCAGLIRFIFRLSSSWWLEWIFSWFFGWLYFLCGCLVLNVEANVCILYDFLLLYLLCCLELVRRVLWGLIFIATRSIPIHSCDCDVSNRTTTVICEDKLIWFISGKLIDTGYESVRH